MKHFNIRKPKQFDTAKIKHLVVPKALEICVGVRNMDMRKFCLRSREN